MKSETGKKRYEMSRLMSPAHYDARKSRTPEQKSIERHGSKKKEIAKKMRMKDFRKEKVRVKEHNEKLGLDDASLERKASAGRDSDLKNRVDAARGK